MPFKVGHALGKGRPKGSSNVATLEKKGLINFLKEEGAEKFIRELNTLEGKEYCSAYIPVVEMAFPKLARTEITGKDGKDLNPILVKFSDDSHD